MAKSRSWRREIWKDWRRFPIGWKELPAGLMEFLKTLLGWLITAAAVSLGAPFWFDLLGKVANLRGSGGKAQPGKAS